MAQKINERTLQMRKNYVQLWEQGCSVKEIAEKFSLSPRTVYSHLEVIAQESGYSREELLQRPHGEHLCYERKFEYVKPVDVDTIRKRFYSALEDIGTIKEMMKEFGEEEKS